MFCTSCGVRIAPPKETIAAPPPVKKSGSFLKFFLLAGSVLIFLFLFGMGSCVYLVYRAKQKIESANGTAKSGSGVTPESSPDYSLTEAAHWKSIAAPTGATTLLVPLKKGLVITGATSQVDKGDYETIVTFLDASEQGIWLDYTYMGPPAKAPGRADPPPNVTLRDSVTKRNVLAADLANAHEIYLYYKGGDPSVYPGTTSMQVSREVFNELKTSGETAFTYKVWRQQTPQGAVKDLLGHLMNGGGKVSMQDLHTGMVTIHCTLRRAIADDVAMPVIVNDKPVDLPAIHTICQSNQDDLHLYILDDAQNPLRLASSSRIGQMHGQTVRIAFPEETTENPVEQDLKKTRRALLYGIYFDFGSSLIRPQSEPVLQQIAKAMADNPDWKLTIEGHTDNIGDAASNLALSQRRSAAVVQALTSRYHISPDRFSSAGFGSSHPVDRNDTLAGRARNRRVELALE